MSGYVYAVDNGRGCVKIGWAQSPQRRLTELSIASVEPLTLIGMAVGTKENEREIHKLLSPWHERGEWFRKEGAVLHFLSSLPPFKQPAPKAVRMEAQRRRQSEIMRQMWRKPEWRALRGLPPKAGVSP